MNSSVFFFLFLILFRLPKNGAASIQARLIVPKGKLRFCKKTAIIPPARVDNGVWEHQIVYNKSQSLYPTATNGVVTPRFFFKFRVCERPGGGFYDSWNRAHSLVETSLAGRRLGVKDSIKVARLLERGKMGREGYKDGA